MLVFMRSLIFFILLSTSFSTQPWVKLNLSGRKKVIQKKYSQAIEDFKKARDILKMRFEAGNVEVLLSRLRVQLCSLLAKQPHDYDRELLQDLNRDFQPSYVKLLDGLISWYGIEEQLREDLRKLLFLRYFNTMPPRVFEDYEYFKFLYRFILEEEGFASNSDSFHFEAGELGTHYYRIKQLKPKYPRTGLEKLLSSYHAEITELFETARKRKTLSFSLHWMELYFSHVFESFELLNQELSMNPSMNSKEKIKALQSLERRLERTLDHFIEWGLTNKERWFGPRNEKELESCKIELEVLARGIGFYQVRTKAIPSLNAKTDRKRTYHFLNLLKNEGEIPRLSKKLYRRCFYQLKIDAKEVATEYATIEIRKP